MCAGCTRLPAPTCRGKCCTGHTHTWWPALHSLSQKDTGSVPHTYIHLHCRTQVAYINTSFILEHRCVSFLNAGCMHMHLHSQVAYTYMYTGCVCRIYLDTGCTHTTPHPPLFKILEQRLLSHTHTAVIYANTLWHQKKCILDHTGCTHTNYSWSNVPRNIYINTGGALFLHAHTHQHEDCKTIALHSWTQVAQGHSQTHPSVCLTLERHNASSFS